MFTSTSDLINLKASTLRTLADRAFRDIPHFGQGLEWEATTARYDHLRACWLARSAAEEKAPSEPGMVEGLREHLDIDTSEEDDIWVYAYALYRYGEAGAEKVSLGLI